MSYWKRQTETRLADLEADVRGLKRDVSELFTRLSDMEEKGRTSGHTLSCVKGDIDRILRNLETLFDKLNANDDVLRTVDNLEQTILAVLVKFFAGGYPEIVRDKAENLPQGLAEIEAKMKEAGLLRTHEKLTATATGERMTCVVEGRSL